MNDERLNNMGSIVLGLNDALVELTGALAGFTFALSDPVKIAKTGLITGLAAASVVIGGERLFRTAGEVEFEPWGLTGAAVYNCTRWAARHLDGGRERWTLELELDGEMLQIRDFAVRPVKESIVTMGGVSLEEVNPETMESRKITGLYFAGEVLDIDGPTGGYNLSIAFATARLAVESICFDAKIRL